MIFQWMIIKAQNSQYRPDVINHRSTINMQKPILIQEFPKQVQRVETYIFGVANVHFNQTS